MLNAVHEFPASQDAYTVLSPEGQASSVPVLPGLTLAQNLFLAGAFTGRPLCSGSGRCGLCRVRFVSGAPELLPEEVQRLPAEKLADGVRLSCLRPAVPGAVLEVGLDAPGDIPGVSLQQKTRELCPEASLGVDLGTTSIQWRFERPGTLSLFGQGLNPQMGAGADVMARLALARNPRGAIRLRQVFQNVLHRILAGLPCLPGSLCVAGNSAMTCLALGLDASGLAAAPYRVDWPGGQCAGLGGDLPEAYIPPLLAPFVGGDISAGLAALEYLSKPPEPPFLLCDMGTNGEFALALPGGTILVTSVPMGPALEGLGMTNGMLAGPGAAVSFAVAPSGLAAVLYDSVHAKVHEKGAAGHALDRKTGHDTMAHARNASGSQPRGISGTGYISLLALLKTMGVMDAAGQFVRSPSTPLAARVLAGLDDSGPEPQLMVSGVEVWARDVEALLKVKAAFNTAVHLLLRSAGLGFSALRGVYLAGALGEHVRLEDLDTLGFLPPGARSKTKAVGNTSLDGACLAAARPDVRQWLAELPARVRLIDVVSDSDFQSLYFHSMRFAYA